MFGFAAGFFVLLAAVPLVVYYFFSKEHRDLSVPSLIFWRELLEGRPPTFARRLVRFVRQPLFWIQLAILCVVCILLVEPIAGVQGKLVVFILDTSASMGAREKDGMRLDSARRRLVSTLDALPPEHPVALIAVGHVARLASGPEDGRTVLRARLAELTPSPVPTRLESAAHLLRFLEARMPLARAHVFTDRLPPAEGKLPPAVEWTTVGETGDNRGIVAVRVDSTLVAEGKRRVRAWVLNGSKEDREVVLVRHPATGAASEADSPAVEDMPRARIAAGGTAELAFDLPLAFRGPLALALAGEDALAADDRVAIAFPSGRGGKLDVAIVSDGPPSRRLTALGRLPGLDVRPSNEATSAEATGAAGTAGAEVLLRELRIEKDISLPSRPSINFLSPGASAVLRPEGQTTLAGSPAAPEKSERLRLVPWSPGHAVADGILSERVRPARAAPLAVPEGAEPLYRSGEACVAYAVEEGPVRHVVFGFEPEEALEEDAGLLLLLQAIEWVHPRAIRPGSVCRTTDAPPPELRSWKWSGPAGDLARAPDTFDAAGVYRAVDETDGEGTGGAGTERTFAASLLDADETAIAPAPAAFPYSHAEDAGAASAILAREIFWRPVVPAALALLLIEWLVYQRALRRRRLA